MHLESDKPDRFFNRDSFCKNLDCKDSSPYLQSDELRRSGALRRQQLFHSFENSFQRIHEQNSSLDDLAPPTPELKMAEQSKRQEDNLIIHTNLKRIPSLESIGNNSQKNFLGRLTKENQRQNECSVSSYQDDDRSYVNSRKVDNQDTPISNSNDSNSFSSDSASQQQIQGEVLQDIRNAQMSKQLQLRSKKTIIEQQIQDQPYVSKTRNFLVLFYYISRFFVKIKRVIAHRKIEGVDDFLLKILNDKAYSKSGMLTQRSINIHNIFQKTKIKVLFQLFKKVPVFEPNSLPSSIWDIVILLTVIFQVSALPIIICFDVKIIDQQIWPVYRLPFCIFLIDILKNFNTGFYRQGHTVLQRVEIVSQYLRARFWWDLGINLALFLSDQTAMLNLFILVRAYDLQRLLDRIDENFLLMHRIPLAFQLLFMTIILVAHLVGCGFHLVALLETSDSWVSIHQMQYDSLLEQYVTSLYWATITMITVGYGDIVPNTFPERLYVLLITIGACGVFGYALNSIGAIFQDRAKRNSEFKEQKYVILEYMRARSISQGVQTKIVKYLEFINAKNQLSHERGEQILDLVSDSFRREMKREYYGSILEKYRMFGTKLSKKCLGELALQMKESSFGPGEVVFQKGDVDGRFFFVTIGELEVFIEGRDKRHDDIILGKITSEKFFGQQGFFILEQRQASVRSTDISRLVSVHIDEFIQTLKQFPQDYQIFCQMRDEMLVGRSCMDQFCYCCHKFSHTANMCPLLHYQVDHEALVKRHLFELPQRRKMFKRRENSQRTAYTERKKVCMCLRVKRLELVGIEDIVDPEDFLIDRDFYLEVPSINIQVNTLGEKEVEILIQEEEEEDEEDEYNIELINQIMENQKYSQKHSQKISFESKRDPVITKLKQAIIKLRKIKDPENNNEDLQLDESESDLQSEHETSVKNTMDMIKSFDNIQEYQGEDQFEENNSTQDMQALLLQRHSQSLQRQLNIQLYLETQTMDTGGVLHKWGNHQFNKKITYSLKQSYSRNLSQEQVGTTSQKQINDQSQTPQQAPARSSQNNDRNDFSVKQVTSVEQQKEIQDLQPATREKFTNIPLAQISTQKIFDTKPNIQNSKFTQETQKLVHQQSTAIPQTPKSPQLIRSKLNKGSQLVQQDMTGPVTPKANNFKKFKDQQARQSVASCDTKVTQNMQVQDLFLYDMDLGFDWSHYFVHNNKKTILDAFFQQQKIKFGEQLFALDLPENFKKRRKQRASVRKASQRGSVRSVKRNNSLRSSVQHSPKSKEASMIASNKRASIQVMMQKSSQNSNFDRNLEGFANHIGQMRHSNLLDKLVQQLPIQQETKDDNVLKSTKK